MTRVLEQSLSHIDIYNLLQCVTFEGDIIIHWYDRNRKINKILLQYHTVYNIIYSSTMKAFSSTYFAQMTKIVEK